MQITTNTLRHFSRLPMPMIALASLAVSACDQIGVAAQKTTDLISVGPRSEPAVTFRARVVGVTDGDTLTVLDESNQQHTIRLAEIDAPERGQPWGARAKQTLSSLVFGKTVSLQQTDTDRYDRVVARVFADGEDVNRAMVGQGAAWAYRRYLTDQALIAVEAKARRDRLGLWSLSDAETVEPWEWRKGKREGDGNLPTDGNRGVRSLVAPRQSVVTEPADGRFSCSGKRYCRQMSSCAEAHFYLRQCGVASLDGNSDGEPCEMLCGTAH